MAEISDTPEGTDPKKSNFLPEVLDKTVIAVPLLNELGKDAEKVYDIIIDLHLSYPEGRTFARKRVQELFEQLGTEDVAKINQIKSKLSHQYLFARLKGSLIRKLVELDNANNNPAIYKIWLDFEVNAFTSKSVSTVKADAARSSFAALGENITWAVIDSGVDFEHPHLKDNKNPNETYHIDLTDTGVGEYPAFDDSFGHGTHVAGIIAGEWPVTADKDVYAITKFRDANGQIAYEKTKLSKISGMAPRCGLVSIKVLDKNGSGLSSSLIAAIEHVQEINGYGRDIKIHGINLSLGYTFDPEWFACGQSPLCVEVDRLVKSGVVVVAAAGNTGYGYVTTAFKDRVASGMTLSINDPGNADLAITVGSTHRDMPHTYGVSYFSSKGPTGDGRLKPDLVAPGEKIISCAAGKKKVSAGAYLSDQEQCYYIEDSGTSMAAPHVSGVIAAFLSIRREYIGKPEVVKAIFMSTATDLKRDHYFQGSGLVDLMRAIQSI